MDALLECDCEQGVIVKVNALLSLSIFFFFFFTSRISKFKPKLCWKSFHIILFLLLPVSFYMVISSGMHKQTSVCRRPEESDKNRIV